MSYLSKSLVFGLGALSCASAFAPFAHRIIANEPSTVIAQSYEQGKCFVIKYPLVGGQIMHSPTLACPVSLSDAESYAVVDAATLAPKVGESLIQVDAQNSLAFEPFIPKRPNALGPGMLASLDNQ